MNEAARAPLLVEVYVQGGHIAGLTHQVEERRRLVDILNAQDAIFELQSAKLTLASSGLPRFFPVLSIDKKSILAAIPHETQDQLRQRAMLNTGIGRSATLQAQMGFLLLSLYIEGTAHVAPGAGKLRPDPRVFTHFFPLTSATLYLPDGDPLEVPVLLLNRDALVSISLLSEASMSRPGSFGT
jgi:hypothetical protein